MKGAIHWKITYCLQTKYNIIKKELNINNQQVLKLCKCKHKIKNLAPSPYIPFNKNKKNENCEKRKGKYRFCIIGAS